MRARRQDDEAGRRHGPDTLRVYSGTVIGSSGDDVFVELGPRMQGVISRAEFEVEPQVGEVHEFTLRGLEEELWILELRGSRHLVSWEEAERGSLVQARVIRRRHGGLEIKVGALHGFLPRSQTGLQRGEDLQPLVGRILTCEVLEVDPERQRVVVSRRRVLERERDSERQRMVDRLKPGQLVHGRVTRIEPYGAFVRFGQGLEGLVHVSNLAHERVEHPAERLKVGEHVEAKVLSIREGGKRIALGIKQLAESPWRALEREGHVGSIVSGVVARLTSFGAFVELRPGLEGLLPRSESGVAPDRPLHGVFHRGERLSVRILELDFESQRLVLSRLHPGGRPIEPDEAERHADFDQILREAEGRIVGHSLERVLRDALHEQDEGGGREA